MTQRAVPPAQRSCASTARAHRTTAADSLCGVLCVRQVLTLNFTFGGPEKVAQWASYPYMRLYSVYQYQSSATPLNESGLSYPGWVSVNTTTLVAYPGDYSTYFSAVCFFTGSAVYDSLKGQVPIGLVQSSYGGTSAEAWTSADALDACGPYNPGPNPPTYMIATIVYNAMMYPLLRVALSGVIWYQTHTYTPHARKDSSSAVDLRADRLLCTAYCDTGIKAVSRRRSPHAAGARGCVGGSADCSRASLCMSQSPTAARCCSATTALSRTSSTTGARSSISPTSRGSLPSSRPTLPAAPASLRCAWLSSAV